MKIRNIKSLQVFGVVSEVQNVTHAAQLLNISQSSVSYHIKKLEAELGTVLFKRTTAGLQPTEIGLVLADHVSRGLATISTGLQKVLSSASSVQLALLPMFASRWLSPRLGALLDTHPDLQVAIKSHNNNYAYMANPKDFADIGIQWGRGNWPDFDSTRLWQESLVVVCSPAYLQSHPIRDPSDLVDCTLLHVDDTIMWQEWFAHSAERLSTGQSQMMLQDRHFQLSSTINGLGVSLFAHWAVRSEIQSGALVNPFGCSFETSFAYYLLMPRNTEPSAATQQFRDWLINISGAEA